MTPVFSVIACASRQSSYHSDIRIDWMSRFRGA